MAVLISALCAFLMVIGLGSCAADIQQAYDTYGNGGIPDYSEFGEFGDYGDWTDDYDYDEFWDETYDYDEDDVEFIDGMPNPFLDFTTIEEAVEAAGFDFAVPEDIEGVTPATYRTIPDQLIEVIYTDDFVELDLRKGADETEISGDYGLDYYSEITTVEYTIEGTDETVEITYYGDDDLVSTVIWTYDGHAYSITVNQPVAQELMYDLAGNIIELNAEE